VKGSEQICHELARGGVADVFGLLGDGNYRYLPLLSEHGIHFHPSRHEAGAIAMADGYARSTGRIGVCTVTHGPGLTHALSALVEVRKSQSPVLLLGSDTPTWATAYSCQDLDQLGLLDAIGMPSERVRVVGTLARDLARSITHVEDRAEPLAMLIPTDVQDDACEYVPTRIFRPTSRRRPDDEDLAELASLLLTARQPLLLAGRGAVDPDARRSLERLAEIAEMLLGTTALAKGLFAGHPSSLGVVGGFATPAARQIIGQVDLVVGFGARFSPWTTLSGTVFSPDVTLVQVDLEAAAIGRHAPISLGLVADVAETADLLVGRLQRQQANRVGLQSQRDALPRVDFEAQPPFEDVSGDGLVDPRAVVRELDRMLPSERTVCLDGGWHQSLPILGLSCPDARGFVFSQTYQSVGVGIGTAIGAALGRPDRLAVLVMGDGGLSMSIAELATAATCGLPVVVVVINDCAYAAEIEGMKWLGLPADLAYLAELDFAASAVTVGGLGITVRRLSDLDQLRSWCAEPQGLAVVDCKVPCPIDYGRGGEDDWIEHIWHHPRPGRLALNAPP
jgi:acetolactate synthase I/II/III large subunit